MTVVAPPAWPVLPDPVRPASRPRPRAGSAERHGRTAGRRADVVPVAQPTRGVGDRAGPGGGRGLRSYGQRGGTSGVGQAPAARPDRRVATRGLRSGPRTTGPRATGARAPGGRTGPGARAARQARTGPPGGHRRRRSAQVQHRPGPRVGHPSPHLEARRLVRRRVLGGRPGRPRHRGGQARRQQRPGRAHRHARVPRQRPDRDRLRHQDVHQGPHERPERRHEAAGHRAGGRGRAAATPAARRAVRARRRRPRPRAPPNPAARRTPRRRP